MSYMGLFWETGMPEAWALSRRTGEKPESNLTGGSRLDTGMMAELWPRSALDEGARPAIPDSANAAPEGNPGRPKPDGEKTKG